MDGLWFPITSININNVIQTWSQVDLVDVSLTCVHLLVCYLYLRFSVGIIFPLLREGCEWRHTVGVVLSFRGLRPEAGAAQQVLSDTGRKGFPHLCVWSVLSHLVLHHHSRGTRTYSTKQGILLVNALNTFATVHQHFFKIFALNLFLPLLSTQRSLIFQ